MTFAATLRTELSAEKVESAVDALISLLGLDECQDTPVGGAYVTGLSGGERKRTSIAFDLISNPRVLILDEPTSGLDSSTAYRLIKYMKKLCELRNMSIICSIHQPSSLIVQLFDQLQCMSDGNVIYSGPPGKALLTYFKANFGLQVPQFYNPADFLVNVANSHPAMSIAQDALVAKANQDIKIKMQDSRKRADPDGSKLRKLIDDDKRLRKYGVQLKEICIRMVVLAIRSPQAVLGLAAVQSFGAFISASLFYGVG